MLDAIRGGTKLGKSGSLIRTAPANPVVVRICNVCQTDFGYGETCEKCGAHWSRVVDTRKGFSRFKRLDTKSKEALALSKGDPFRRLPRKTRKSLKKLQEFPIPLEVAVRLRRRFPFNRMSDYEVNMCLGEFKKFMAVLAISHVERKRVAMTSEIIDEVWHTFVLFTREYHLFSWAVAGKYIHHTPNAGDERFGPEAAKYFYEVYQKYFGKLHPAWKLRIKESNLVYDAETNSLSTVASTFAADRSPIANYGLQGAIRNGPQNQPIFMFGNYSGGSVGTSGNQSDLTTMGETTANNGGELSNIRDGNDVISVTRYELAERKVGDLSNCDSTFDSGCGGSCGTNDDGSDCGGGGCGGGGCGGCGGCG